jgi:hypothetical protein
MWLKQFSPFLVRVVSFHVQPPAIGAADVVLVCALRDTFQTQRAGVKARCVDLLTFDGHDFTRKPLTARRKALKELFKKPEGSLLTRNLLTTQKLCCGRRSAQTCTGFHCRMRFAKSNPEQLIRAHKVQCD